MNFEYGDEYEETEIDTNGSTLAIIRKVHGGRVAVQYKRYNIRIKVYSKEQELDEYEQFTKMLSQKRASDLLVKKETDPSFNPAFVIDYPPINKDGGYFISKRWTELTQ